MPNHPHATPETLAVIRREGAERPANDDMVQGYMDGFDLSSPEPSAHRSHSYRHGFANGRDDRANKPRASAALLRQWADEAMEKDDNA